MDYTENRASFERLIEERKKTGMTWGELAVDNLLKSWFAIIESTGGAAEANENSPHQEERILFHIEKALKEIKQ